MKISVIIPAYNAEETIIKTLESVLNQMYSNLEVVVIDDASSDGTSEVVNSYLLKVKSGEDSLDLILLRQDANQGPAAARNRGIKESKGEWLAFLDADDEWLPEKLENQMNVLDNDSSIAMLCGETIALDDDFNHGGTEVEGGDLINPSVSSKPSRFIKCCMGGEGRGNAAGSEDQNSGFRFQVSGFRMLPQEAFAVCNPVATSTVLVKKQVLEEVGGFDEQFKGPEDYDLWMRVAAKYKVIKIDVPLSRYRTESGSLSMDDRNFLPEVLRVIDKAYGEDGVMAGRNRRKAVAFQYLDASWMASERGAPFRAFALWSKSLFMWPFSFAPEKELPWGRMKLLVRFTKNFHKR